MAASKVKYRDLTPFQRSIVRRLRKNPVAAVYYLGPDDMDKTLTYLKQHGYKPKPGYDKIGHHYAVRTIDSLHTSNVLMQRIIKSDKW